MSTNRKNSLIAVIFTLMTFFMTLSPISATVNETQADSDALLWDLLDMVSQYADDNGYDQYLKEYSNEDRPDSVIRIEGEEYIEAEGGRFEIIENYMGLDGKAVITPESGTISWAVRVEEPGLYNLRIHYFPIEGKSAAIERMLLINKELPFKEAELISFDRVWGNRDNEVKRDDRNNELRPVQVERPRWLLESFMDRTGHYNTPYLFYFDKGEHTISLAAVREPVIIDYIELYQEEEVKTYDQIKKEYQSMGLKPTEGHLIKVQAENAVRKSSPTLYPISDRSSPLMEPYHISKIRMNAIGGYNWRVPGQWIEWEIEVPETGLYKIALKRKQDHLRGVYATRSLTIDGKYPFEEMKSLKFNFNRGWQTDILGNEEEAYLFYLTEGTHRIRLTATLGDIAPLIRIIQNSVLTLNETYRKVVMITSTSPDPYRDYQLERRIPNLLDTLTEQAEIIEMVADYLVHLTGEKSDMIAPLYNLSSQLKDIVKRPETLPRRLDSFRTNIGALGTWILTVKEQPLTLDYLIISSPEQTLPKAEANLWQKLKHEVGAFIASYSEDYTVVGNIGDKDADKTVTVWVTTGRDQAQTIKAMIDDEFTPNTNISVKLRLVPGNILLPATLAGEGPDIAMQVGEDIPVNYGMRNAAIDLTQFPDFEEVANRFHESALLPYRYEGGVFGLPEQQIFPVLFYREDILEELNIEPPKTWDEVYYVISVLKKHNLDFYLPIETNDARIANYANLMPNAAYSMLLYQNGGEFYRDNGKKSGLDSETAIDVFRQWTRFYTNYKLPIQADFVNRFRTGEMPIGIGNYNIYNTLAVFAPEIKGLWDFSVVPGTIQEDGSIRHDVASSTFAIIMLRNVEDKDSAWEFMKWWTSKDTQVWFGREMEALMGEAARYPTANMKALEELPWPVDDYNNLMDQWQWVQGIPQVPGGYFTGRHLDNAFRKVLNSGENYREAILDYVIYINDEIETKRQEFNLPY